MLKNILRRFNKKNEQTVVTFTGGMGAQILSAAIYFSLKQDGRSVYADLSYFDTPENIAAAGEPGGCSHWAWQLSSFGILPTSFEKADKFTKQNATMLEDGVEKLRVALEALEKPEIQKLFKVSDGIGDILPVEYSEGFLCIHVRRGDYVNVASHLITDDEFLGLVRPFAGLIDNLVVLSDSPIGDDLRAAIGPYFKKALFLDNIDAFSSHRIMRSARVLVCSNSQFSLIAAMLNPNALVVLPKQWFGGKDRDIEAPIQARCSFQIMTGTSH